MMNIAEILVNESEFSAKARELIIELLGEVKVCSISERQAHVLAEVIRNHQSRKDDE